MPPHNTSQHLEEKEIDIDCIQHKKFVENCLCLRRMNHSSKGYLSTASKHNSITGKIHLGTKRKCLLL